MPQIGKWTVGKLARFICITHQKCGDDGDGTFTDLTVTGDTTLGTDCTDTIFISGSLTGGCCPATFWGGADIDYDFSKCGYPNGVPLVRFLGHASPAVTYQALSYTGSWASGSQGLFMLDTSGSSTPTLVLSASQTASVKTAFQVDSGDVKIIPPDGTSKISLGKSQFGGTVFPIELDYDVAGEAVIRVSQRGDTTDSGDLWLNKSRGTEDSPTPVQGGDHVGQIAYTGQTTTTVATGYARTARIVAGVDEVSGAPLNLTSAPGYLQFQTTKSGSALGVHAGEMILSQEGNLGIGSNTSFSGVPYAGKINARLHVDGTAILGGGTSDFVHVSGALTASSPARFEGVINAIGGIDGPSPLQILNGVQVTGSISGSSTLKTDGAITTGGALNVTGTITAAGIASGSIAGAGSYVGLNSSNQLVLTSSGGGGGGISFNGSTANGVVTYGNATTADVESNLTFDGSTLAVAGAISGSSTLHNVGAATLGGTLNVTGTITAAGIASGSIAGAGSYIGLNASNQLVLTASAAGGSTSPGGSDTQIQFNDGGSFGGDADFTWNKTANALAVTGTISSSGNITTAGDLYVNGGDIYGPTDANLILRSDGDVHLYIDQDTDVTTNKFAIVTPASTKFIVYEDGKIYSYNDIYNFDTTTWDLKTEGDMAFHVDTDGSTGGSTNTWSFISGSTTYAQIDTTGAISGSGKLKVEGDITTAGALNVTGSVTTTGAISGSGKLKVEGNITTAAALNVTGTITAAGIASGSIAGAGSYVGLNSSNQLVLTASSGGGGGGAPTDAQYVTLAVDGTLSDERVLTAGDNITLTDGGAGSTITIAASDDTFILTYPPMQLYPVAAARTYMRSYPYAYVERASVYRTGQIPAPGSALNVADNDLMLYYGSMFVMPTDGILVSASYGSSATNANVSCTALRNGIVKIVSGTWGSPGGAARNTNVDLVTMYYDDLIPDSGDMRYKVYQKTFACTGSDSHLSCSAGDIVMWVWETFGASAGYHYWVGDLMFKRT